MPAPVSAAPAAVSVSPAAAAVDAPLHLLDALAVAAHDVADVAHAVEILLELVDLAQQLVEPRDLPVRHLYRVAGPVVLLRRYRLALLRQVLHPISDLPHQLVEVPRECREGRAVEQQEPL